MGYKETVNEAYEAVKDLAAEETYKLEGFKLVLTNLLAGVASVQPGGGGKKGPEGGRAADAAQATDWQTAIAYKLGIEPEQVADLYHLDDDDTLRLLLEPKRLPRSQAAAMKDVAALLAAGRQAAKFDAGSTSFDAIRKECEEHNCLNKSNFTKYLNAMKPRFIVDGKGQNQALRATTRGFDEAGTIAKKYLQESA